MLEAFMKVAQEQALRQKEAQEMHELLMKLPVEDLKKLASGMSIKEACGMVGPNEGDGFLDRFKGTPLLAQALQLMEQELKLDAMDLERREQQNQMSLSSDNIWTQRDKLRLQKRLLELELAKQQNGGQEQEQAPAPSPEQAAPPAEAQAPAAPAPEKPKEEPALSVKAAAFQKLAWADSFGRQLAHVELEKAAQVRDLTKAAQVAGPSLVKVALGLGSLAPMASKVTGWAMKNPGMAGMAGGAALGAAGGALAGGKDHRLSGALGGAALGGALGGAGAGIGGRMAAGQGLGQAAANTARSAINTGMRGVNTVASRLPGQAGGQVSGFAQNANQMGHDFISRMAGG